MDLRLKELAEERYKQPAFLANLFELAIEKEWFHVQHMIQHDMAKAIISDYAFELGYRNWNNQVFLDNWEDVIHIGWRIFCEHTGLTKDKVDIALKQLQEC